MGLVCTPTTCSKVLAPTLQNLLLAIFAGLASEGTPYTPGPSPRALPRSNMAEPPPPAGPHCTGTAQPRSQCSRSHGRLPPVVGV